MKISIIGRILIVVLEFGESVFYCEIKKEFVCEENLSGLVLRVDEKKKIIVEK